MRGKLSTRLRPHSAFLAFNEARALCAGSSTAAVSVPFPPATFNEARALCAGSYIYALVGGGRQPPSMRPAHYAREVAVQYSRCAVYGNLQ